MSQPPKIEFPCEQYPIKSMGKAGAAFRAAVLAVMEKHAPGFDTASVQVRPSSKGSYESVTVFITATGVDQLQAIFNDLKAIPDIRMVL